MLSLLLGTRAFASPTQIPTEVVDAFHKALKEGNAAGALSLLAQDVVVYEFGVVDPNLQAYVLTHLPADMNVASQTELVLQTRRMAGTGDQRWVMSSYRETGAGANGAAIDQIMLETMILEKSGDSFRIVHMHWSTAPAKK